MLEHRLDQRCPRGQGAREKARCEVFSDIFCMLNQTKTQQNEVFFQVALARIVGTRGSSILKVPQDVPPTRVYNFGLLVWPRVYFLAILV